jgi:hypothetical protein
MDPETSWTLDERLDGGLTHDDHVSEENIYENDPETENALRYEVSKLIVLLALNAMRRSHWGEYNNRVELLLLLFRFMRLKRRDENDVKKMVEFIVETKFGGAEEMAEFKDLGYSFQDNYVLEIIYAIGNRTSEGFLDTLSEFYNMDVFTLYTKNSIKILRAYIQRIADNDPNKLGEMKIFIMGMILTHGNPSFKRFGLLLRNLYDINTSEGKAMDLNSIRNDLKQLSKEKENFFLECEDSVDEMFKEVNIGINVNSESDEIILKEIKKIIHKNTTLNSKNGKVVNRYEKDGDRKGKRKIGTVIDDDINNLKKMISKSNNVDNKIPNSNEDESSSGEEDEDEEGEEDEKDEKDDGDYSVSSSGEEGEEDEKYEKDDGDYSETSSGEEGE